MTFLSNSGDEPAQPGATKNSCAVAGTSGQTLHRGEEGADQGVPLIVPVVFEAAIGASASPPVRLFLGTEPAQHRAERIFFYSLERVRDPLRRYEVYRMTGLPGFRQEGWRTGFTNYRFAIPDLAGRYGRAIYNDVDQLYTADPALLFDQPMGGNAYLALSTQDTAVMLIDCERMARYWSFNKACRESKKALHAQAAAVPGLWGALDPLWHARDIEYRPGQSRLLHYTTLHTQPWRPTPEQYSYHIHPFAEYFLGLEQAAEAAGYEIYTSARPSSAFAAACEQPWSPLPFNDLPSGLDADLDANTTNLLALVGSWDDGGVEGATVRWTFDELRRDDLPACDAVAASGLEHLPVEDVPWVLARLFERARRWIYVKTTLGPSISRFNGVSEWRLLLRRVALRYPGRCWQLDCADGEGRVHRFRADFPQRSAENGRLPSVWVLLGKHAGDNAQMTDIADALGWPYELKQPTADENSQAPAAPPWPDLVISAGRRTAPLARSICQRSGGLTRTVVLGRPRAPLGDFDLVLTTPQYGLPLRDNVVDMPAPFIAERQLDDAALEAWRQRFAELPRPWVALLVGGNSMPYRLDSAVAAELGHQASLAVAAQGGSLLLSTSPRTPADASQALLKAIDTPVFSYCFGSGDENPYGALLALADAFIVTGESVSMLTEACMMGRPVAVFPLPVRRHIKARLHYALERRLGLIDRAVGSRGTPRQQNRAARLYDELVAAGRIKRERRTEEVHLALGVSPLPQGLAHPPGLSPAQLANARARALAAIRALIEGERPL
ncbi:ELM1/GtrOC1 family putative glycosyltransferase [Pseudomonas veronii]